MTKGKFVIGLTAILALSSLTTARADEEWDTLDQEWQVAIEKWQEDMSKHQTESGAVILSSAAMMSNPADAFRARFKAYAEKHAGKSQAIPALAWMVSNEFGFPGMGSSQGGAAWAVEVLGRDHAGDPGILEHLEGLRFAAMSAGEEPVVVLLEAIAARNANRETAGLARVALAELLYYGPPGPPMMSGFGGAPPDRTEQKKKGEEILRDVAKEYAGTEVAKQAEGLLFAIEHLQVGQEAPELVGKDVNGHEIRLSEFRGKVVMIVFWATWCSPCMQMLPHERELVARLKDKPFVMLGISADHDAGAFKKAIETEKMTWPNIHDAPAKTDSICAKWRIESFPTILVLDHKGVIRHRDLMPFQIDGAINALLVEALAEAGG